MRRITSVIYSLLIILIGTVSTPAVAQLATQGRIIVNDTTRRVSVPRATPRTRRVRNSKTGSGVQAAQQCQEGCGGGGGGGEPLYAVTVSADIPYVSIQSFLNGQTAQYTITNTGQNADTYTLSCTNSGNVTCTNLSQSSVSLGPSQSASVTLTFSTGQAGSGASYVSASGQASASGSQAVTVFANPAPSLSLAQNNPSHRATGLCEANCFDFATSHGTVPFFTLDQPRQLTLTYNSAAARPTPVVFADVSVPGGTQRFQTYSIQLLNAENSTYLTLLNGANIAYFTAAPGSTYRVAAAFDAKANGLTTGWTSVNVIVSANYSSGGNYSASATTRVLIEDESGSAFGAGVAPVGLERLYFKSGSYDVAVMEGGGSIAYYQRTCSTCAFITPASVTASLYMYPVALFDQTKYEQRFLDGSVAAFRTDGRMLYLKDRFGNKIEYIRGFGGDSLVSEIRFPMTKSLYLTYSTTGGVTTLATVTDPAGRVTRYTYDATRRLTTIQDPDSVTQGFGYTGTSTLVTSTTDRGGFTTTITYDGTNHPATVQLPQVPLYDGTSARPTKSLVSTGMVVWQPALPGTSAANAKTAVRADTVWATTTDPMGRATREQLDRFGAPVKTMMPGGLISIFQRDTNGRIVSETSPRGHTVTYLYSGYNLVRRTDGFTGAVDSFAYTPQNRILWSRVDGVTREFTYNGTYGGLQYALLTTVGEPEDGYHFQDAMGRDTMVRSNPNDTTTASRIRSFGYDPVWGNKNRRFDYHYAEGWNSMRYRYFGMAGRMDSTSDNGLISRLTYDLLNRVRTSTAPGAALSTTTYDTRGNAVRVVDAKGQVYRKSVNAAGWPIATFDLADTTRADSQFYDLSGALRRVRRRSGVVVTYGYDTRGRVTSTAATGAPASAFRYDSLGVWTVADNGVGYDSAATDIAEREVYTLQGVGGVTVAVTKSYDAYGHLLTRQANRQSTPYFMPLASAQYWIAPNMLSPDSVCTAGVCVKLNPDPGCTLDVTDGQGTCGYVFNPNTPQSWFLARTVGADGTSDSIARKPVYPNPAEPLATDIVKHTWWIDTFGSTGGVATWTNGAIAYQTFSQDSLLRLIDECPLAFPQHCPAPQLYTYDAASNRTDGGSGTVVLGGNRYQKFHGVNLTYDLDGNVTALSGTWDSGGTVNKTLFWDGFGHLVKVKNSSTDSVMFGYDASGQRVSRTVNGVTTLFIYDAGRLLVDLSSAGEPLAEYGYYGPTDALLAVGRGMFTSYVAIDQPTNGSINQLVDHLGYQTVKTYSYGSWGATQADTGFVFRFRFAGAEYDQETGFYHMGSRYYYPSLGRFVSEDPTGIAGGMNLYAYAGNNPVSHRDPLGFGPPCRVDFLPPDDLLFHSFVDKDLEKQEFEKWLAKGDHDEDADCKHRREQLKEKWEEFLAQNGDPVTPFPGIPWPECRDCGSFTQATAVFRAFDADYWEANNPVKVSPAECRAIQNASIERVTPSLGHVGAIIGGAAIAHTAKYGSKAVKGAGLLTEFGLAETVGAVLTFSPYVAQAVIAVDCQVDPTFH